MADTNLANASRATAAETKFEKFTPKPPFFFELSRLMVVAVMGANGQLVYRAQTKPNGPWEANWTPIDSTRSYGTMAAGLTSDGRVAVVAQPTSQSGVLYIDEKPDTMTQAWNAPFDLGKPAGVTGFYFLATAFDVEGRVEVFGTDTNGNIWWKYQNPNRIVQKTVTITPPGTHTPITVTVDEIAPPLTPWSNWFQIPGGLAQIKALRNADGRIILFGINLNGHLYRCEQKVARALQPSDWTGWVQMDTPGTGTFWRQSMAPTLDAAGAVNLFVITQGNQVLHARQSPPCTSTWTGWSTPGIIRDGVQAVAAGIDGDDHLVVVASDMKFIHNMTWQLNVEAQQWSGWNPFLFGSAPTVSALAYNADGRLSFFTHLLTGLPPPNYGGLWLISQMAFDSTEWEWTWTELAKDGVNHYAVVRDLTPPT